MSCYFPASLFVDSESGKRVPPTGIELSRQLAAHLPETEYVAELTEISGRSAVSIKWLLAQNAVVPAGLLAAALRLSKRIPVAASI